MSKVTLSNRFVHPLLRARDWQNRPEFNELCEWWRKKAEGVCSLVGIGGAGKTAIAERFLRVLPGALSATENAPKDSTLPQAIVFSFSFYDAPNPDRFFGELGAWLTNSSFDDASKPRSYQQVLQLLSFASREKESAGASILFILDGLEKVQTDGARGGAFGQLLDGRLSDLLRRIAGGYLTTVASVITSRFAVAEMEEGVYGGQTPNFWTIRVEEISERAGTQLLKGRGVRGTVASLRRVVKECGYHALTVDLVGGYLAEFCDGSPDVELLLGTAGELESAIRKEQQARRRMVLKEELRFAKIASRYYEALAKNDPAALALLERICLFRLSVTPATLSKIFTGKQKFQISGPHLAALNQQEIEEKLEFLARMRLLDTNTIASPPSSGKQVMYSIHPAIRDGFRRNLNEPMLKSGHEQARKVLLASLHGLPGAHLTPTDPTRLDLMEEIIHHTIQAGLPIEAWSIYHNDMGGFRNLGARLGEYERGERICRGFCPGVGPKIFKLRSFLEKRSTAQIWGVLEPQIQMELLNSWGLYLKHLGRLDSAAVCFETAAQMAKKLDKREFAAAAIRNLADVHFLGGNIELAAEAGKTAQEEGARDNSDVSKAIAIRAYALSLTGNTESALDLFDEALEWQNSSEPKPSVYETGGVAESERQYDVGEFLQGLRGLRHASLLVRLGRTEQARRLLESILEVQELHRGANKGNAMRCKLVLAELAIDEGDLDEAVSLEQEVRDWALACDSKEVLCWSLLVNSKIQLAQDFRRAGPVLEEAIFLSRESGYGLYHIDLLIERARLYLRRGQPELALEDLRVAIREGIKPTPRTGLPELRPAKDRTCSYAWGIAEGAGLRAEALLLEAAGMLRSHAFSPTEFSLLPSQVQSLITSARRELNDCLLLRKSNGDPKSRQTQSLIELLNEEGILTQVPVENPNPVSTMPLTQQNHVFISYSHKDKKFLDELLIHLKPLERAGKISKWTDRQIAPGSKWLAEIEAALSQTKVAVLLVTPNFLASDFIQDQELAPLLKKAENGGVRILWIPVRPCAYKDTRLHGYQAAIPPDKPLSLMKAERDSAWVRICDEIKKALKP